MFTIYMSDSSRTWHLDSEGNWTRHDTDDQGNPLQDVQSYYLSSRSRKNVVDKV
jgi:polyphosphate kinase